MKIRTLVQVVARTAGGQVYSAGEGAVSIIDDADEDMVALMRRLAAAGQVELVKEPKTETKPAPAKRTATAGKGGESA